MAYGIKRFSYGLAKKMLFANTFAATVDWMMEKPLARLGTVNAWMLAVLYTRSDFILIFRDIRIWRSDWENVWI